MIHFVLIIGLFLLVIAVTMLVRGASTPAGGSSEALDQIGAYGFAGALPTKVEKEEGPGLRSRLDDLSTSIGRWLGRRFKRLRGKDYRSRLIAAGMYTTTPERLLGTQFLAALAAAFLWLWLSVLGGAGELLIVIGTFGLAAMGWVLTDVHRQLERAEAP